MSWPGKIVKSEITGTDCYYTDGAATYADFKLEFSNPGYHVFYVKKMVLGLAVRSIRRKFYLL